MVDVPRGNDIRRYLSPTPANRNATSPASHQNALDPIQLELPQPDGARRIRRRIIITSSSNSEDDGNDAQALVQDGDAVAEAMEPAIGISDSDDMYVSGIVPRNARRQRAAPIPITTHVAEPRRSHRSSGNTQQVRPQLHRRQPSRNTGNRWQAEAEECSDEDDDGSADESDPDAADLYRSAIMGVRNRPAALLQVMIITLSSYHHEPKI